MKIEKCQKKKLRESVIKSPNIKFSKSDDCIIKKSAYSGITKKNNNLTIQKGAQSIDSYNSRRVRKPVYSFGDAETYFRRTLRSFEEIDVWRKTHLDFTFVSSILTLKSGKTGARRVQKKIKNHRNKKNWEQIDMNSSIQLKAMSAKNELEETETTAAEDDEDIKDVNEIIVKASRELEQVAEENQQLLKLLEKSDSSLIRSQKVGPSPDGTSEDFIDTNVIAQLEIAEQQAKDCANIIFELKTRVGELLKKKELTEKETRELDHKNKELKKQMTLFEEKTKKIQCLIEKTNLIKPESTNSKIIDSSPEPRQTDNTTEDTNFNKNIKDNLKSASCSCQSTNIPQSPLPTFAKKLCQSYTMQEKLAAENADLESVRFKLQEELLNRDQTLECLQRELGSLQNEMRLVSRENTSLNEKLKALQHKNMNQNIKHQQQSVLNDVMVASTKLQEYSDNTYQLEKQLADMENDVKYLHEEISAVQREREHLEKHRKMMYNARPCMIPPANIYGPLCAPLHHSKHLGKKISRHIMNEFHDQYERLESSLKNKLNELVTLKADYEKLRKLTKEAEDFRRFTEENLKQCEASMMNKLNSDSKVPTDHEQQLVAGKKRLKKARDTLKGQELWIKDQKKHLELIKNKYFEAHKQLEQQRYMLNLTTLHDNGAMMQNVGSQILSNLQDQLEVIHIKK